MAMRKSERLLNLLIMLLVTRRPLDRERIREVLYDGSSDEAFDKMFERDKDDLRQLGVPIEIASQDAFFDDEQGYRIRRAAFELPDISLEADEAAVVGLAARVWQHAGLAGATSAAMAKLVAAGVAVDRAALDLVEPQLGAEEPSFDGFWAAARDRRPVAFDYRRSGVSSGSRRRLQPWRVAWSSGRWYVLGLDLDREEPRLFRLSRVVGEVVTTGPDRSYELPTDVDFHGLMRQLTPQRPAAEPAVVLVRSGRATGLRRQADDPVEEGVSGPDDAEWDRLTLRPNPTESLADQILSFGPDAYVESPAALREEIVRRLETMVGEPA